MPTFVYGSSGGARDGASETVRTVGAGDGVAVTPWTNPEKVVPRLAATVRRPPAPRYSTTAPSATTARVIAMRTTSGIPRLRAIGRCDATRPGCGARGRTLTGAGRPLDGGRGRTCVGRGPRRVVIATIVTRAAARGAGPVRTASPMRHRSVAVRCTLARSARVIQMHAPLLRFECRHAIHGPGVPGDPRNGRATRSDDRPSASGPSLACRRRRPPETCRQRTSTPRRPDRVSGSPASVGMSARTST